MSLRIPLTIVSGFLGSGKTTLLRRFLESPESIGTGVVINEFGEVGLDHRLLVHAAEQLERVDGGCLCCARRSDIARSLQELVRRTRAPGARPLGRIVLETTGLADPAPIIAEIGRDAWMQANIELVGVICVLDAVHALANLDHFQEARRQIAMADVVLVSKTDLSDAQPMDELTSALRGIAPDVLTLDTHTPEFDIAWLIGTHQRVRPGERLYPGSTSPVHSIGSNQRWSSFVLPIPFSIDWAAFTLWLSALLHAHGERIVRVKGILRTSTSAAPVVIHGVQHVMHPPTHLSPAQDDGSPGYLVFITDGLEHAAVECSLVAFLKMAESAAPDALKSRLATAIGDTSTVIAAG